MIKRSVLLIAIALCTISASAGQFVRSPDKIVGEYIVVLKDGPIDIEAVANQLTNQHRGRRIGHAMK